MAKQVGLLQEKTARNQAMTAEMKVAQAKVREKILSIDVNRRIQLDGEELQLYVELKRVKDFELEAKEQVANLQTKYEREKKSRANRLLVVEHSRSIIDQNGTLHLTKDELEKKLKDLEFEHSSAQQDIVRFKQQVQTLKRKRAKGNSPPPPPTKLLVRPQSPHAGTESQASSTSPTRSDSPSLLQPAAKKSRSRKARWDNVPVIPSSDNVNELEKASSSKAAESNFSPDPVLLAPLTSFSLGLKTTSQRKLKPPARHSNWGGTKDLCFIVIPSRSKSQSRERRWHTLSSSSPTIAAMQPPGNR
jgi:hypothetical protein